MAKHGKGRYDYSEAEYVTAHVKVTITCRLHGRFEQTANAHLRGAGCPVCGYEQRSASQIFNDEWFVAEARKVHGDVYDYQATVYRGQRIEVTLGCPVHGFFDQLPFNHLSGNGCPPCWALRRPETKRLKEDDFIDRCRVTHGLDRYDYSKTVYIDMHHSVRIMCPSHGEFSQRAARHVRGDGCPRCSESRGEKEIRKALVSMSVSFESQWTHPNLRLRRPLYFDFAIPDMQVVIEFDGEQHRRPVRFRGISQARAEHQFELTKQRDATKNAWVREMGWTLIRLFDPKTVAADLEEAPQLPALRVGVLLVPHTFRT